VLFGDGRILRWERISLETEIAHPKLGSIVDLTHRIQNSSASATSTENWLVHNGWQIRALLDRLIQTAERDDQFRGVNATRRPHIPGKSDAIAIFVRLDEFLVGCHCFSWICNENLGVAAKDDGRI
jgi:hypothetical protein